MIRPTGRRVLIERTPVEEEKSGLLLVDSAKIVKNEGLILAVNNSCLEFKPGDKVLFGAYEGYKITSEDKEYLILDEEKIIGIIE